MVTEYFTFLGTNKLLSKGAAPFHILTRHVSWFHPILAKSYWNFDYSHPNGSQVVSHRILMAVIVFKNILVY